MPLVQRLTDLAFLDVCLESFVSLSTRCTEKLGTLAITGKELLNPNVVVIAPGGLFWKSQISPLWLFSHMGNIERCFSWRTTMHNNYQYEWVCPLVKLKWERFHYSIRGTNTSMRLEAEGPWRDKAPKAATRRQISEPCEVSDGKAASHSPKNCEGIRNPEFPETC